jgi:NitT/TauT family transport system ATP-binding protein
MITDLSLHHIGHTYINGNTNTIALDDISLEVRHNEIVALIGPSGCGKSTILNIAAHLLVPTKGSITYGTYQTECKGPRAVVVFQADALFPWMTVEQNTRYGMENFPFSTDEIATRTTGLLRLVELEQASSKWPRELSGGMKKRVDLARAYACDPLILLLDEPFGSLDPILRESMQRLLMTIHMENNKTTILATHDIEEAIYLGNRVVLMSQAPGRIVRMFDIPFSYPRKSSIKLDVPFIKIRGEIIEAMRLDSISRGTRNCGPKPIPRQTE